MDLNTTTTLLIALAPSISAILTIIGCLVSIVRGFKKILKNKDKEIIDTNNKLAKAYDDIAVMKTKIASIEKHLVKKEK